MVASRSEYLRSQSSIVADMASELASDGGEVGDVWRGTVELAACGWSKDS